jgi:hypothetical protein
MDPMDLNTRNAALNNSISPKRQDLAALARSQPGGLSHLGPGARPCDTRGKDDVSCGYLCQNPPIRLLLVAHVGLSVSMVAAGIRIPWMQGRSTSMHPQPGYHACRRVRTCKQLKNTVQILCLHCTLHREPPLVSCAHVSTLEPRPFI